MPYVDLVNASTVYRMIDAAAGPLWRDAGFVRTDKRTWVRSTHLPIREVISFVPPLWPGVSPFRGASLDYVPHVSYRQNFAIRWTSGPEDAELDLFQAPVNPITWDDHDELRQWHIPVSEGLHAAHEGVALLKRERTLIDLRQEQHRLPPTQARGVRGVLHPRG